jgi:hypothetical protein
MGRCTTTRALANKHNILKATTSTKDAMHINASVLPRLGDLVVLGLIGISQGGLPLLGALGRLLSKQLS